MDEVYVNHFFHLSRAEVRSVSTIAHTSTRSYYSYVDLLQDRSEELLIASFRSHLTEISDMGLDFTLRVLGLEFLLSFRKRFFVLGDHTDIKSELGEFFRKSFTKRSICSGNENPSGHVLNIVLVNSSQILYS